MTSRSAAIVLTGVSACLVLTGCTVDQYGRMLIEQDTNLGRIREMMVGTSEQLVRAKRISTGERFVMPDGTEIDVWVVQAAETTPARGTVLVLHGLCDSKVSYLELSRQLSAKGFDVVLTDLRAHGRSTGRVVTYGALEKQDQKAVLDKLLADKVVAEPLYVFGTDLGASVGILYAAIEPRVRGVVAIAASRDMNAMCRRFLTRNAILLSDDAFAQVMAKAGQTGRLDPKEASAMRAVASLRCPLLLIHGRLDAFVPFTDSEELFDAARGPKELELIPWARHFGIIFAREGAMVDRVEKVATGRIGATTQPAK